MDPSSAVDKKLKDLQNDSSSLELENRAKKYRPILKKVRELLNKERAVYYGGMAQNEYLPASARFYAPTDLPDYDVFVPDPQSVSKRLADALREEGYEFITVRHAFHDNTYKVSLDFEDVADITGVSVEDARRMRRRAKKLRDGTLLCPLALLKANAHIELAMPRTAMFRWKKVYDRIKRLENAHPILAKGEAADDSVPWIVETDARVVGVTKRLFEYAKKQGIPIAGSHAAMFHTAGGEYPRVSASIRHDAYMDPAQGRVEVLSSTPSETAHALRAQAREHGMKGLRVVGPDDSSSILNKRTVLEARYEGRRLVLAEVHHVEGQCYGVREHHGVVFASAFYLLYDLYMRMYMTRTKKIHRAIVSAILRNITVNDITSECYGTARSMLSAKRSKAKKKAPLLFYEPGES